MINLVKSPLTRGLFSFNNGILCYLLLTSSLYWCTNLAASDRDPLASSPAPVSFTIGVFTFTRPLDWKWMIPSSAMRKVQLSITSSDGKQTADVSFFTFGEGQGGNVQANVERWAKQFSTSDGLPVTATTESRKIASISVTFVSAKGSFSAGMSDSSSVPKPGYALRGAIVEIPAGGSSSEGDLFIKMTGPEKLVEKSTPTFDSMVTQACREAQAL